jgi:hypothetical protein
MRAIFHLFPPVDAGARFVVGPPLTICEAAMLYAGRHPHGQFLRDGSVRDHEEFIRTNQTSWDVYCDLMRRAERGSLPLEKRVYLRDGRLDPRRSRITFEALLELAQDRGDADALLVELAKCVQDEGVGDALADEGRATIGAETQCALWLAGLPASPVRRREDVRADAMQSFGKSLSNKAFDRAWAKAAHPAWKRSGPKVRRSRK